MDKQDYQKIIEGGRKNFVRGLNRVYWKFYTDKDYMMAGFKVGFYYFSFLPDRDVTQKFIEFLKQHETIDKFPIYPSEIANFFNENTIKYKVNFKRISNSSFLEVIKSYLIYKENIIKFNI